MQIQPKTLTARDISQLIGKVVTENHHLDDAQSFTHFLEDLAGVVTDYFGGALEEVYHDDQRKEWLVLIQHDENVLEGGIYDEFDVSAKWPGEESQ